MLCWQDVAVVPADMSDRSPPPITLTSYLHPSVFPPLRSTQDTHPGTPPLPPPLPEAEMASTYSTVLYVTRRGRSPPHDGDRDDSDRYRYSGTLDEPASLDGRYGHQETTTSSSSSTSSFSGSLDVTPAGDDGVSEKRWRNSFDGVSQYKPPESYATATTSTDSSTLFQDLPVNTGLSSASSLPEATQYTRYLLPAPTTSTASTPRPLETYGSLGDSDSGLVYGSSLSRLSAAETEAAAAAGGGGGRRSWEWEEPRAAPVSESEARTEEIKLSWDASHLAVDRRSTTVECTSDVADDNNKLRPREEESEDNSAFTGVFQATRVALITEPISPSLDSPDQVSPYSHDMEVLKDTLKSLGPSSSSSSSPPSGLQKRGSLRGGAPFSFSSLAPIVEDGHSPTSAGIVSSSASSDVTGSPEGLNGRVGRPLDLGLGRAGSKDPSSPLDMMKPSQQVGGGRSHQSGVTDLNVQHRWRRQMGKSKVSLCPK